MNKIKNCIYFFLVSCIIFAGDKNTDNKHLLNQYIESQGNGIIVFDSTNIKQFWIDRSIICKTDVFEIFLSSNDSSSFESVPLKIQLINVNETQDCKIDVITKSDDLSFDVLNSEQNSISTSVAEEKFLDYAVYSSRFHLENTTNFIFCLKFFSKTKSILPLTKILISFTNNQQSSFLASPKQIRITSKNVNIAQAKMTLETNDFFSVSGKKSFISFNKKILVSDNSIRTSLSVENTGLNSINMYIGYITYHKNGKMLRGNHYPYKGNNDVLNVISSTPGNNILIVDHYPEWSSGCFLATDVKEDLSDVPNFNFVGGTIRNIKQLDNGQAEITLEKPLSASLNSSKVRIHGSNGAYFYTNYKTLQSGKEVVFSSDIKKDDNLFDYSSSNAFPRGTYCVVPLILSYSVDSNIENTILIKEFSISF